MAEATFDRPPQLLPFFPFLSLLILLTNDQPYSCQLNRWLGKPTAVGDYERLTRFSWSLDGVN